MQTNRREFTILSAATAVAGTLPVKSAEAATAEPWYRRVRRYGQINITENDAANMDIAFWRRYWKDTHVGAMVLNAGGVVAYYPTKIAHHRRAAGLGNRDLFGELAMACKEDGIEIVARITNDVTDEVASANPDWLTRDVHGNRSRFGCMNGGFIYEHMASIVKEIAATYKPAGFSINGGGGWNYNLCYCQVCTPLFKKDTGLDLPREKSWEDPTYRKWVQWNAQKAANAWDMFNRTARAAGGPECYWIGQDGGSLTVRNMNRFLERTPMIMHDHQTRTDSSGMQQNAEAGKITHSVLGWDKIVAECQAIYGPRLSSKPAADAQMWMYEGMAGGIAPWWHTISAHHHDKRRYATAIPVFDWHRRNEEYLFNRTPVAAVGLVWSEDNNVFYGRDDVAGNVEAPWRGIINALVYARIPWKVIYADRIDQDSTDVSVLILPNLAAMTDVQVASVERFVARGGGLFATGDTSLHDGFGDVRPDYALAHLFGAHWIAGTEPNSGYALPGQKLPPSKDVSLLVAGVGAIPPGMEFIMREWTNGPDWTPPDLPHAQERRPIGLNTYVRFTPELRANVAYSPHPKGDEPPVPAGARRHPILKGFDETDVIGFGGLLPALKVDPGAQVLATLVPESPFVQAEEAYWRTPKSDIPALIVNTLPGGGRVVFMPADVDRQFAANNLPDHADLIANIIRWAAKDDVLLTVETDALVDCHLYQQKGRMVLHVLNLTNAATWRGPLQKFISVGAVKVRVKLNSDVHGQTVKLLVAEQTAPAAVSAGWVEFSIPNLVSHEVIVIA